MEMCYRGVKYNYNPVVLDLATKENSLGYNVARTQTIQTKFLGRVCQKETVSVTVVDKRTRFLGRVSNTDCTYRVVSQAAR